MEVRKTDRQAAGRELLAEYAKLSPSKRDMLQKTLLEHAFVSHGDTYIEWDDRNESARAIAYMKLNDVSQESADAWFQWAAAIEAEGLSPRAACEAILGVVGDFVCFRFLEEEQPQTHP